MQHPISTKQDCSVQILIRWKVRCYPLRRPKMQRKQHLFTRLRSDDDDELEQLVDRLCEIEGIVSRKMFDYGWFFAKRDTAEQGVPEA